MKILLIEDNPLLGKSIARILKQEGITVEYLKNGEEGEKFWMIHNKSIDLVLLDIMLPWKNGIEICKTIRKKWITTPILMLTAKGEIKDKVLGFRTWADDYLVKPFDYDELLVRIQALMKRPKHVLQSKIELACGVNIDIPARVIEKNGEKISLTPKELGILEFLVHHKNRVVTQQEIFDNVFDFAKDNWSNTIEVHIKNIRKKLFWEYGKQIIETVRGVGYKMEI
jgi:two-component system, OmpR family, copper resistance phosphate regulon response regulator CusR